MGQDRLASDKQHCGAFIMKLVWSTWATGFFSAAVVYSDSFSSGSTCAFFVRMLVLENLKAHAMLPLSSIAADAYCSESLWLGHNARPCTTVCASFRLLGMVLGLIFSLKSGNNILKY
jgi:hypothetical protein